MKIHFQFLEIVQIFMFFLRFYAHSMCNIFMKTRVIATFLFVCLIAQSHLQLLLISAIF